MKAGLTLPDAYSRVVLDTPVILSAALFPKGAPAQLVDRLFIRAQMVFSARTFVEMKTHRWEPKFNRYITM